MNAALRKALAEAQLTETDVAARLGVDPKTVRRWLSGQRPYPRHRWALAELLRSDEDSLWSQSDQTAKDHDSASEHIRRVYAHRWQVPREAWVDLFSSANQEIGILAYSGLFIADDAGLMELLKARAQEGVSVRVLLGDPDSDSLKKRGLEEQVGELLSARARNSLMLFQVLSEIEGVDVRIHSTVLYSSIYLTDKKLLVNQHTYGITAAKSPTIEINIERSPEMEKIYLEGFNEVWRHGSVQYDFRNLSDPHEY